jgi:hypothetical protein
VYAYNWSAVSYARKTAKSLNTKAEAKSAAAAGAAAAEDADDTMDDTDECYVFEDTGDDWIEADGGGDAALDDRTIDQNPALRARHAIMTATQLCVMART